MTELILPPGVEHARDLAPAGDGGVLIDNRSELPDSAKFAAAGCVSVRVDPSKAQDSEGIRDEAHA